MSPLSSVVLPAASRPIIMQVILRGSSPAASASAGVDVAQPIVYGTASVSVLVPEKFEYATGTFFFKKKNRHRPVVSEQLAVGFSFLFYRG